MLISLMLQVLYHTSKSKPLYIHISLFVDGRELWENSTLRMRGRHPKRSKGEKMVMTMSRGILTVIAVYGDIGGMDHAKVGRGLNTNKLWKGRR